MKRHHCRITGTRPLSDANVECAVCPHFIFFMSIQVLFFVSLPFDFFVRCSFYDFDFLAFIFFDFLVTGCSITD